jgi:hypothetical protein
MPKLSVLTSRHIPKVNGKVSFKDDCCYLAVNGLCKKMKTAGPVMRGFFSTRFNEKL